MLFFSSYAQCVRTDVEVANITLSLADILPRLTPQPAGPYYPTGFKPVSLLATSHYVRAGPGGTGGYKVRLLPQDIRRSVFHRH
jgi:hypothetical protein